MANIGPRTFRPHRHTFKIYGIQDELRASALKEYLETQPGVHSADVDPVNQILVADLLPGTYAWEVEEMAASAGFAVRERKYFASGEDGTLEAILLAVTAPATILSFAGTYYNFITGPVAELLGLFIVFICGFTILKKAFLSIFSKKFDLDLLNAIAVIAPLYYSMSTGWPFYYASGIIVFIILAANLFSRSIEERFDDMGFFLPGTALVNNDGKESWTGIAGLKAGDTIIVKPGFRIPVDGIVVDGESTIVQADRPCQGGIVACKGAHVDAGALVTSGRLSVKCSKDGEDRKLRETASAFKSARKHIDVPIGYPRSIEQGLLMVSLFGSLFIYFSFNSISAAASIIILATPCAMSLARPLSLIVGRLTASLDRVEFSSHESVERMSMVDTVVINGLDVLVDRATVSDIIPAGKFSENDVKAALSSGDNISWDMLPDAARECSTGTKAGGYALLTLHEASRKVQVPQDMLRRAGTMDTEGKLIRYAVRGNELVGMVSFEMHISEEAKEAIDRLGRLGVKSLTLLSAESPGVSEATGRRAGITNIKSRMSDREKQEYIGKQVSEGKQVLAAGKRCELSIYAANACSMVVDGQTPGFEGLEDVRCGNIAQLPRILSLAKKTAKYISQGMTFALYFNTFAIILASISAALGIMDISLALLMVVASVVAVATNSARLYFSGLK